MDEWSDILITDQDITLDAAGIPAMVAQRPTITQDIVHMVIDSGILIELVGERSQSKWTGNMTRLETLIEDDTRIVPGTVQVNWDNREKIYIFAESIAGDIEVEVPV